MPPLCALPLPATTDTEPPLLEMPVPAATETSPPVAAVPATTLNNPPLLALAVESPATMDNPAPIVSLPLPARSKIVPACAEELTPVVISMAPLLAAKLDPEKQNNYQLLRPNDKSYRKNFCVPVARKISPLSELDVADVLSSANENPVAVRAPPRPDPMWFGGKKQHKFYNRNGATYTSVFLSRTFRGKILPS